MKKHIKIIIFLLLNILFLYSCSDIEKERPQIENGHIDLNSWNFQEDGKVKLSGDWEFYWNEFLTSEDFKNNKQIALTHFLNLPNLWNGYDYDGKELPGSGYGTLRLLINIDEKNELLALRIGRIETAYNLFING